MTEENTEEVLETEEVEESNTETGAGIDNLDDALKALAKVRKEAAARRLKNKETEDKAAKWEAHVNSQKTELERLTEDKAASDRRVAALELNQLRNQIAQETELDPELLEFLTGSEDEMRAKAKTLSAKTKADDKDKGKRTDFYAGQRGKPVTPVREEVPDNLNDYFAYLWKQSDDKPSATAF